MDKANETSRITTDLPKSRHKKLKAVAALHGKSMKEIFIEAIDAIEECLYSDHYPNKETLEAIKNVEEGKNLKKYKNVDDLFKKLKL